MSEDVGRSIFVLAGMPFSGVADVWTNDLPRLFGKYSEDLIELGRRTDKSHYYFKNFKAKAESVPNFAWPDQVMLRLEITEACSFKRNSYDLYRDENFVLQQFRDSLSGIFGAYAHKVINTIEPDFSLLAQRCPSPTRDPSNVSLLYKNRDEETFRCIVDAWNKYLAEISCTSLRTDARWDREKRNVEVIAEAHASTRARFSPQWKART